MCGCFSFLFVCVPVFYCRFCCVSLFLFYPKQINFLLGSECRLVLAKKEAIASHILFC